MSLTGYRWWIAERRARAGWQLRSLTRPVCWTGPHLMAARPPRATPPPRCGRSNWWCCGIYAFKSAELVLEFAQELRLTARREGHETYPVWGTVELWGKVVEHERGYRAEHALVRRLVVPEGIVVKITGYATSVGPPVAFDSPEERVEILDSTLLGSLRWRYGAEVTMGPLVKISML